MKLIIGCASAALFDFVLLSLSRIQLGDNLFSILISTSNIKLSYESLLKRTIHLSDCCADFKVNQSKMKVGKNDLLILLSKLLIQRKVKWIKFHMMDSRNQLAKSKASGTDSRDYGSSDFSNFSVLQYDVLCGRGKIPYNHRELLLFIHWTGFG